MIIFKEDGKTIKSDDMKVGQTGIVMKPINIMHAGTPIMKVYNDVLISLIDGVHTWEGNPGFEVRLCNFELREI